MIRDEFLKALPNYRRSYIETVTQEAPNQLSIITKIPRSRTCPDLLHYSPSDFTLTLMQAAYVVSSKIITDLPEGYRNNALFLGFKAVYRSQDTGSLQLECKLKKLLRGPLNIGILTVDDPKAFSGELMVGMPEEEPEAVVEHLTPKGESIGKAVIDDTLSIYRGIKQANVADVGYDYDSEVYEAAIKFPKYSEIGDLEHISAKQMIESLMKAVLCGTAHQAYLGNLPLSYQEFLASRLLFRTYENDLKFKKLLGSGSQSLVRFHLQFEDNACIAIFEQRSDRKKEDDVFATGKMVFYLPEAKS